MNKRQRKFLVNGTHLALPVALVAGLLTFPFSQAALIGVVVSGVSMFLVSVQFKHLLNEYYDRANRAQVRYPVAAGLLTTAIATLLAASAEVRFIAVAEFVGWLAILGTYLNNRRKFTVVGDGPLPSNAWLNPPDKAIGEGYLVLMSGFVSRLTKNSVGHMELVLRYKGKLHIFTSYIEKGLVYYTLRSSLRGQRMAKGHYIVMAPVHGFTQLQNDLAVKIAELRYAANKAWLDKELPRRQAVLDRWLSDSLCAKPVLNLFMPKFKQWVAKKYLPTGYDGVSMWFGTHHKDRWTCQWICLEVLKQVGVPIQDYETGFLGLGTGLLNPPNPIGILSDPAYRLLTVEDQAEFERLHPQPATADA